jgi:cold shock CspA family protein
MTTQIFISYAKEDRLFAERLCNDLQQAGVKPWLDSIDLIPGQDWNKAIRKAISKSSYFLALLSSRSVRKTGFVQREVRFALEVAEEYPEDQIFIIPVRIDECEPSFEGLKKLHRVDFFPSYKDGLRQLLRPIKYMQEEKPALVINDFKPWAGKIEKLLNGFGFIKYNDIRKSLFFHANELVNIEFEMLNEGDAVTCLMAEGPNGGVAVNVTLQ